MKLFINAGGKGIRLYPLTINTPKPMIKINGKPVLHHLVDWAKSYGIKDFVFMTGFRADIIKDYFKDGKDFGVNIVHSIEPYPLGSGGSIKFAQQYIDDTFIYINGDSICKVDLNKMIDFHKKNNADMTIFVSKTDYPIEKDTIEIDENFNVKKIHLKNTDKDPRLNLANKGLCIIEPKILSLMDKKVFNFEHEIYPKMINNGMKLLVYHTNEFMEDMGTPELLKICEDFLKQ